MDDRGAQHAQGNGDVWVAGWRVHPSSNQVSRDGEVVRIEPRTMAVLLCLAEQPGEVVTREKIEAEVWPGMVIGYDALSNSVSRLRKVFGDDRSNPTFIETIPKVGYRLIAAVQPVATGDAGASVSEPAPAPISSRLRSKLAVILHADVVDSTALVQHDEALAHERIQATFRRFGELIESYTGIAHEIRGDALVAEFARASDAVTAALAFQAANEQTDASLPLRLRVGIALGEVIVADHTVTGGGVVLAQRLEQIADPGSVCIQGAIHEAVPGRLPLDYRDLGEQQLKGIADPVRAYTVALRPGQTLPEPELTSVEPVRATRRNPLWWMATGAIAVLVIAIALLLWFLPWAPEFEPASTEQMAYALPDKPSIAVLAFENLSGDPDNAYLSDGISENIITELSRFEQLFVISRQSSFSYKDKPVTIRQVSEELGVRYVLQGSAQVANDRLRVTAQLINALEGNHVWAESYDRSLEDVFAVQDEITRTIVATLTSNINLNEFERVRNKPPSSLSAYETIALAAAHWFKYTREDNERARELYQRARTMDPDYAEAYRGLAWVNINGYRWGWTGSLSRERSLELAFENARKALELAPYNHRMHQALANALIHAGRLDEGLAALERALELNPNEASVLANIADPLVFLGRPAEAIPKVEQAIRLNPYHPVWYLWNLAAAKYYAGDYEGGIAAIRAMKKMPNLARRHFAALLVSAGRVDEAKAVIEEFLEKAPDHTLEEVRLSYAPKFRNPDDLERFIDDLRIAGLPGSDSPQPLAPETQPVNEPLPLPDKPSIVVLPFDNMSGNPEQEYFVDGMTEDLITDLSKISGLFVIARNSAFAYKEKSHDVRTIAKELGVKYVLEGSVRRSGDRVRINAQLIDSGTGGHLWADRYDGALDDVFALQDQVTRKIITALSVSLTGEEQNTRGQNETKEPRAYDAFLQGWEHYRSGTPTDYRKSIEYFEKAIEIDEDYSRARAALAAVYWNAIWNGWWRSSLGMTYTTASLEARLLLDVALEEPTALALQVSSQWSAYQAYQSADKALDEAERAITLDGNDPAGYLAMATALLKAARPAQAERQVRAAMRLDPHYPASYLIDLSQAQFLQGHYRQAAATLERAAERNPDDDWQFVYLASTYGHLGRVADAERAVEKANARRATLGRGELTLGNVRDHSVHMSRGRWVGDPETLRRGLQKAGVESAGSWFSLVSRGTQGFYSVEGVTRVDAAGAKELHDRGVVFVDVNRRAEEGHIPGAHYLEWYYDELEFNEVRLSKLVHREEEFVVYSREGNAHENAAYACAMALSWGFEKVYYFADGLSAWKAAGYPVEMPD